MQIPADNIATGRLVKAGNKTRGRLNANKETRTKLLPAFDKAQTGLKAANQAMNDADDAVDFISGPVEEVDENANELLTDFQLDAMKAVNKNLKHPLYAAVLPDGLTGARKLTGREMQTYLGDVHEQLKDLPKEHALFPYIAKMATVQKAYDQPCKQVEGAEANLAKAETTRATARQAWVKAWEVLYGELRAMFPGRQGYVEGFFTKFAKPVKVKKSTSGASGEGGAL